MSDQEQEGESFDGCSAGTPWAYSETVKRHFFQPINYTLDPPEQYNGVGLVGSPACGDMMKVWILVDTETEKIKTFKWQTFGCASAIASTSMLSEMVTENGGLSLEQALKIKPKDIIERLQGLPDRKIHCSVLGDQALRSAINDYFEKTGQLTRKV